MFWNYCDFCYGGIVYDCVVCVVCYDDLCGVVVVLLVCCFEVYVG